MLFKRIMKPIAFLTALCVFLTAVAPAFAADETSTVYIHAGEEKKIDGSVLIPDDSYQWGVDINNFSGENGKALLEITGGMEALWGASIEFWKGVASLVIGGNVTSKGNNYATGIRGSASNGSTVDIDISQGAITAKSENSVATGVSIDANGSFDNPEKASIAKAIIGKDVNVTGNRNASGVSGSSSFGSEAIIDVEGNITAKSENNDGYSQALTLSTVGEESKATVTVGGNVEAVGKAAEKLDDPTYSNGGGEATVKVAGEVKSDYRGIYAVANRYMQNLSQQEIEAIRDKLEQFGGIVDEDKYYFYTDENGDQYICREIDGHIVGLKYMSYAGSTKVSVGGNVIVESEYETPGTVIGIEANNDDKQEKEITIGGDVVAKAKGSGSATGISGNAPNGSTVYIDISQGAVTAESENYTATGVSINASGSFDDPEKASSAKISIGKDVNVTGEDRTQGVSGSSTYGSEVTIDVGGNVTAESESTNGNDALTLTTTGEESKATVTVGGNVEAVSRSGDYWVGNTNGVRITNRGGEATAKVTGDVKSSGTGINTCGEEYNDSFSLSQTKIEAIRDKLTLEYEDENEKHYSYTDETGDRYECYEYNDGSVYGYKYITRDYAGATKVSIGGNAIAENEHGNQSVSGIEASNRNNNQEMEITIGGDVIAKGNGSATGISGSASNGSTVDIDVSQGTVTAESENGNAIGVSGKAYSRGEVTIDVGGNVTVKSENGHSNALVLYTAKEESQASVTVHGDIEAISNDSTDEWFNMATGIQIINEGGTAKADVEGNVISTGRGIDVTNDRPRFNTALTQQEIESIKDKLTLIDEFEDETYYSYTDENGTHYSYYERKDGSGYGYKAISNYQESTSEVTVGGNVTAKGDLNATGVQVYNELLDKAASNIVILVNGSVTSDGTGIDASILADSLNNHDAGDSKENLLGKTMITILDDVTAKGTGIWIGGPATNTEIVVDGTVSGEEYPIRLGQSTDTESLILTVWAIEPDDSGAVIRRATEWDPETRKRQYPEDEAAEAQVQYIIRVEQPKKGGQLYTEGTTEYQGYEVAHEGDTVYLKAELKPGFRILKAFYDTDKIHEMEKEGKNVFSMTVPRGGAVLLSALIGNIQKQESVKPQNPVYTEKVNYDKYASVDRNEYGNAKTTVKFSTNGASCMM